MVEDGRLGCSRGGPVVMRCDCVQKLCSHVRVERVGALLDQTQPEMDVAEQPSLLRLPEGGAALEL